MTTDFLGELESIFVAVPNHIGALSGKRIAAGRWEQVCRDGLPMPDFHLVTDPTGQPVDGMQVTGSHTGFRNDLLRPDPATLRRLPWDPSTALVIADPYRPDGAHIAQAPRAVLAHQVERLADRQLTAQVATELEFYLFQESYQEAHRGGYRKLTPMYHRRGDNDVLVTSYLEPALGGIRDAMSALGAPPETTQGEGGIGQAEINFPPRAPVETADLHVLFKYATKALAFTNGLAVTFLAKPNSDRPGSSCHIHISLWSTAGDPATLEAEDDSRLGQVARWFLAGLMTHTPELALMHAPYANSYRRLQPGSFAPATITWGYDNRSTLVRVIGSGPSLRLEFRLPGADVNPYLSIAALLIAGIAGLDARTEPLSEVTGDAYQQGGEAILPQDLTEAVQGFASSTLAQEALGADVHQHILDMGRNELAASRRSVTDFDQNRGFETA